MRQETLHQYIHKTIGLVLSARQLEMFVKYTDELLAWNERMNLTAITEYDQIAIKHYCDSLLVMNFSDWSSHGKVLDLGTGAGFPGLPLKIANPHLIMTLLDSQKKRIAFLNHIIDFLEVQGVETIHGRAEDIAKVEGQRESYDFVLSRAVAKLPVLLEYALPFAKIGGYFVAYKGPDVDGELADAKKALKEFGGEYCQALEAELPEQGGKRKLLIIKKVYSTPVIYPRKAGMTEKKPIV